MLFTSGRSRLEPLEVAAMVGGAGLGSAALWLAVRFLVAPPKGLMRRDHSAFHHRVVAAVWSLACGLLACTALATQQSWLYSRVTFFPESADLLGPFDCVDWDRECSGLVVVGVVVVAAVVALLLHGDGVGHGGTSAE